MLFAHLLWASPHNMAQRIGLNKFLRGLEETYNMKFEVKKGYIKLIPSYPMDNVLFDQILQLEKQLININPNSVLEVIMEAPSLGALSDAHRAKKFLTIPIRNPFELSPSHNYYSFSYQMKKRPKITITVKSPAVINDLTRS